MVRAEILDQIQSRIISKSSSVEYFLNLLELIVKDTPNSLYNYITRVCIRQVVFRNILICQTKLTAQFID